MKSITFHALGTPKTQGSMHASGGKYGMHHSNPKLADWRRNVRLSAAEAMDTPPVLGRVFVIATFVFARPKCHFGTGRNADMLKESARKKYPKSDIDKLQRAILDGMTGVVYGDDSQVVTSHAHKVFTEPGGDMLPGVYIRVTLVDEDQ